jgi:hypothetical protein
METSFYKKWGVTIVSGSSYPNSCGEGFVIEMHLKVKGVDTAIDCVVLYDFVCCFVPMYLYEMVSVVGGCTVVLCFAKY